jgi:hypothetical protein
MTDQQLDHAYTALAQAITRQGKDKAQLFLATLALSLIASHPDEKQCLQLIEQAESLAAV